MNHLEFNFVQDLNNSSTAFANFGAADARMSRDRFGAFASNEIAGIFGVGDFDCEKPRERVSPRLAPATRARGANEDAPVTGSLCIQLYSVRMYELLTACARSCWPARCPVPVSSECREVSESANPEVTRTPRICRRMSRRDATPPTP